MTVVSNSTSASFKATRRLRGEAVTYARGESISIEISTAVRGKAFRSTEEPTRGVSLGERSQDWLILATDITDSSGNQLTPARGDTITDASGEVFRVMPFVESGPLYQWHDTSGRTIRRIFSKERS